MRETMCQADCDGVAMRAIYRSTRVLNEPLMPAPAGETPRQIDRIIFGFSSPVSGPMGPMTLAGGLAVGQVVQATWLGGAGWLAL